MQEFSAVLLIIAADDRLSQKWIVIYFFIGVIIH